MKKRLDSKKFLFILGIAVTLLMMIPYWIHGENAVITYHDQLDGEVITYLLNAKYLFKGADVYPEIMNGIPAGGLASPAPGFVLLYKFLTPFAAFMTALLIVKLVSFGSMFFLLCEVTERKWLAFFAAVCFMALPFYAVYGLCIPGQPLLWLALLKLRDKACKKPIAWYAVIALYGLFSSLALVGFACILLIGIWGVYELFHKRMAVFLRIFVAGIVLTGSYAITNLNLIAQMFGGAEYTSHKSEVVFAASGFWNALVQLIMTGDDYTGAQQKYMLPFIGMAAVISCIYFFKNLKTNHKFFSYALLVNTIVMILVAVYRTEGFVELRNSASGVLHDFNFGRISWLTTVLWYILFVAAADILLKAVQNIKNKKFFSMAILGGIFVTMSAVFFNAFMVSDLKANVAKLIKGKDYYMMTYKQFYAQDLFEEVDRIIGRPKEDYRVVSLGIYPAAASYNGFYCLDAYSNNYDVAYKHEFRKIIQKELDKSPYLTHWFDEWGNRCCIVLAESNNYFTFEQRWSPVSHSVELDMEQLKKMGCEYIISASYIMDPDASGVTLLNEEPIRNDESWYRLWVYEIQ